MVERDIQLDCYRALTMIYIVCIIHTILWFHLTVFNIDPTMIFEMPVIFFIAGASQIYTQRRTLTETIRNRALRILLPYYIFIGVIIILMIAATTLHISFENELLDIRKIGVTEIIKLLLTGGNPHIPYLGYTWFISTYMIISCSLPLQQWIITKISDWLYLLIVLIVFYTWKITGIISPENIIESVLCYNFFYILGYVAYRKIKPTYLIVAFVTSVFVCPYLILSGMAIPFCEHKFPADIVFLIYSLCTLCLISFFLSKINIKYNYILKIWNDRGYTIYLYQSISHFMVYKLTDGWRTASGNEPLVFIVSALLVFIFATALSYITVPMEKYIISKIFPKKSRI